MDICREQGEMRGREEGDGGGGGREGGGDERGREGGREEEMGLLRAGVGQVVREEGWQLLRLLCV